MQHLWSFWHCTSLSSDVVGVLHRICYWRASSTINSSELVVIAFYCRSVLDLKQCLSNEKLPRRYGNISLAKLLFSKSGFCVNIKPFIYNESTSAAISSYYFNVICQEHVFFSCIPMERSKILQELADWGTFQATINTNTNVIWVWLFVQLFYRLAAWSYSARLIRALLQQGLPRMWYHMWLTSQKRGEERCFTGLLWSR